MVKVKGEVKKRINILREIVNTLIFAYDLAIFAESVEVLEEILQALNVNPLFLVFDFHLSTSCFYWFDYII